MSTVLITIKSDLSGTDVAERLMRESADRKEGILGLSRFLDAVAKGVRHADVDAQYSATDPVAASGTLTLASAIATDAVTIGSVTLTASSTPADEDEWEIDGADDTADAAALAAAINAHSTLSEVVSATSDAAVVTVTAKVKGEVGNHIPLSSADATITASGSFLAGGTGGGTSDAETYDGGL